MKKKIFCLLLAALVPLCSGCIFLPVVAGAGVGGVAAHEYRKNKRNCPYCDKTISRKDTVCPYCGKTVEPVLLEKEKQTAEPADSQFVSTVE